MKTRILHAHTHTHARTHTHTHTHKHTYKHVQVIPNDIQGKTSKQINKLPVANLLTDLFFK